MTLLRSWFAVSGALIGLGLVWAFVPILIPLFAIAALLGAITALTVRAARWFERRRGGPPPGAG